MKTPLFAEHEALGGKIVDFFGWDLPIHYGSQIEEHHAVRQSAGMFDVSHMTIVKLDGQKTESFLRSILANDVRKLEAFQAMYSCFLNADGGVLDDLIVYKLAGDEFYIVFNAATRDKVLPIVTASAETFGGVNVLPSVGKAIIAVQGPEARQRFEQAVPECAEEVQSLKPFRLMQYQGWLIARTGYTGEDGVEVILPAQNASDLWVKLLDQGIRPCGLGARDTLRMESGLNLYGQDMDESVTPLVSNLAWTVNFDDPDRQFVGREALEQQLAEGFNQRLVGVLLQDKGVLREGQKLVMDGQECGVLTSGGFSPILEKGIGFARINLPIGDASVDIRGKLKSVSLIELPFVRKGKIICKELK